MAAHMRSLTTVSILLVLFACRASAQGCVYEGITHQQGERWTKLCELDCVCNDATTGHYTCTAICPTYNDLPASCTLVKPAGQCCSQPSCSFATQSPGGGTVIGTGTQTCRDTLTNCQDYGTTVCTDPQYAQWSIDNCAAFCHKCTGTGTGTGTTAGTLTGTGCTDAINDCAAFGQAVCTDPTYDAWVRQNCARFCNKCSGTATGTGTTAGTGTGTCADVLADCSSYGQTMCTDPQYDSWVRQNCAHYCNKCSGTTTSIIPGGTRGPISGHSNGCVFKGTIYQQGETFNDGCSFRCTCSDAATGQYTCQAMCYTFNLPEICQLLPPPPGKCCEVPSCPADIQLDLPPGYVAN